MSTTPHFRKRNAPVARAGQVPDDLVGIPYSKFTPAQHKATREWRFARAQCEGCGAAKHMWQDCRVVAKKVRERERKGLCIFCGSRGHDIDNCTEIAAMRKKWEPFAEKGQVHKDYVGWSLKMLGPDNGREMIEDYRADRGLCTECASAYHNKFACQQYIDRRDKATQKRLEEVTSGLRKLKLELTGPLAELPTEIRLRILRFVVKDDSRAVKVEPGWLPWPILQTGLPANEIMQEFLSANVFAPGKHMERFRRVVRHFNAAKLITSLSDIGGLSDHLDIRGPSRFTPEVIKELRIEFPKLCKIQSTLWQNIYSRSSNDSYDFVKGIVDLMRDSYKAIMVVPGIKAFSIVENCPGPIRVPYTMRGYWRLASFWNTMGDMEKELQEYAVEIGREDMYVALTRLSNKAFIDLEV